MEAVSAQPDSGRLTVSEFVERIRHEMIPVNSRFSYFATSLSLSEEDMREYLAEPIAALPPKLSTLLPPVSILLVPYLERANGRPKRGHVVEETIAFEKPGETRICFDAHVERKEEEILAFGVMEQDMVDYHYRLFRHLARLTEGSSADEDVNQYFSLLREELSASVHGEVDEQSWRMKQGLLRRQKSVRQTKAFRDYARQSLVDTLTLYLHGICCDIDVETGPRQLPSRFLRRRLQLLQALYPPPEGYAVFPEEVSADG
jgi:hypothetical protein